MIITPRIPGVITAIDRVQGLMKWRRVRYQSTPPKPGDFELYGDVETGHPIETATIDDYTLRQVIPVHALYKHGSYLIEPNAMKPRSTSMFASFSDINRHGWLVELNPDTLQLVTGRVIPTPLGNPVGCAAGKKYVWTADASLSALLEYSTSSMGLLRRFSLRDGGLEEEYFPRIPGVNIVVTSVGGKDNLLYLFGRNFNFGHSHRRMLFVIDVVGPDRELVVRQTYDVNEILGAPRVSRYVGGGDDVFLYIAEGGGELYTLRATNLNRVVHRSVGGTITGFGGNSRRCFSANSNLPGLNVFRERKPTTLGVVKSAPAFPFFVPTGISYGPD